MYALTPYNQWDLLIQLDEPARKNKYLTPKFTEELILKLCQEHWLTRKQISSLVQRNSDSLRTRFLTPMVRHNLLKLKYPERLNRTDQAYQTVDSEEALESQIDSKIWEGDFRNH